MSGQPRDAYGQFMPSCDPVRLDAPQFLFCVAAKRLAMWRAVMAERALTDAEHRDYLRCYNSEQTRQRYHRRMGRAL